MNEAERYLHRHLNPPPVATPASDPAQDSRSFRPQSSAADTNPGVFCNWWSLEGRLGRQIYIQRLLIILAAMVLAGIVLNVLAAMAGADELLGRPVGAVVVLGAAPFALPQHTRRLHDLGWSGWWQLLFLVPIFGLFFRIFLWCKPGTPGRNPYGQSVV